MIYLISFIFLLIVIEILIKFKIKKLLRVNLKLTKKLFDIFLSNQNDEFKERVILSKSKKLLFLYIKLMLIFI